MHILFLVVDCTLFLNTHSAYYGYIKLQIILLYDLASSVMGIAIYPQNKKGVLFRSPKNLRNNRFDSMKTDMVVPESKFGLDLNICAKFAN